MKVLFLGYNSNQTGLTDLLIKSGCSVESTNEKVDTFTNFDLVICFGYRHIISKELLDTAKREPINLHISFLPFNKGSHPNFWSFFENTTKGVSIHHIDQGIDTGDICFQREVKFLPTENTFSKTHRKLIMEIESLFEENLYDILNKNYTPKKQKELEQAIKNLIYHQILIGKVI